MLSIIKQAHIYHVYLLYEVDAKCLEMLMLWSGCGPFVLLQLWCWWKFYVDAEILWWLCVMVMLGVVIMFDDDVEMFGEVVELWSLWWSLFLCNLCKGYTPSAGDAVLRHLVYMRLCIFGLCPGCQWCGTEAPGERTSVFYVMWWWVGGWEGRICGLCTFLCGSL